MKKPALFAVIAGLLGAPVAAHSTPDANTLRKALDAANDRPDRAQSYADRLDHALAEKLVAWRVLDANPEDASFRALNEAITTYASWPSVYRFQREAEKKIDQSGLNAQQIVAWFATEPPKTPEGTLAYAKALKATGKTTELKAVVHTAWRETLRGPEWQADMLRHFGAIIPEELDQARAEMLRFSNYDGTLQELRRSRSFTEDNRLYANYVAARRHLSADEATAAARLLLKAPRPKSLAVAHTMWTQRAITTRKLMKQGQGELAYELVADHGLSELHSRVDFAEAEWLAGWVALQYLNNPVRADLHFARLQAIGTTPITLARAQYWRGRAAQMRGLNRDAQKFYTAASAYGSTFYGQLAQIERKDAYLRLPQMAEPDAQDLMTIEAARVLPMLATAGEEVLFNRFALHLDDVLDTREQHAALASLANRLGKPHLAVRIAKTADRKGLMIPNIGYPLRDVPRVGLNGRTVEPAFALALMRQESEFNPTARSHANARGLMQLLPSTAQATARKAGLSYSTRRLYDADYNAQLGTLHLSELLHEFDGSYILVAAAYNAGAHRVRQWLVDYGDPRASKDPIAFIESIPYRETRNYVMRVIEATQVYRARMNGGTAELKLSDDIRHRFD